MVDRRELAHKTIHHLLFVGCIATAHLNFRVIPKNYCRAATASASPFVRKKATVFRQSLSCGQRDSNPHASRHQILSLTWLPITPCPQDLASDLLDLSLICGAKIKTFYNICNFICDFLENFSYFCILNSLIASE